MAHDTKNHGWRADDFTLVRAGWTAQVSRSWCADDDKENCWRWYAWPLDENGSIGDHDIQESVQRHYLTFGAAIAGAEAYIAAQMPVDSASFYAEAL